MEKINGEARTVSWALVRFMLLPQGMETTKNISPMLKLFSSIKQRLKTHYILIGFQTS